MREYWTFLESYSDVYEQLNNKQKIAFMDALIDVQKLRVKVDDITFDDRTLRAVWAGLKHTIRASINGYLSAQKSKKEAPCLGVYDECDEVENTPLEGAGHHPQRELRSTPLTISNKEVSNKEVRNKQEAIKEKNIKKENPNNFQKIFSFTLNQKAKFQNLSDEYKTKLKAKIESLQQEKGYSMDYEAFGDICIAKGYAYADFNLAYQNWAKRESFTRQQHKPYQSYQSYQKQDMTGYLQSKGILMSDIETIETEIVGGV